MLKPLASSDATRLREFLDGAGYTEGALVKDRSWLELPSRGSGNLPILLERTREPSVSNLLVRWFFLGVASDCDYANEQVPESILALLVETGLLTLDGSRLAPAVMLTPCDQCVFASDPVARLDSQPSDLVVWPNPTSRRLVDFTIRRPSGAALDVGSGCGIQAILAARHSEQVTGTDLNPRAAEFTRFNAWLNGVETVEFLVGDTFEPVAGRTFDLIVANPPFFVTPSAGPLYCENRMELDEYCGRVAREGAGHLNDGGYLQMVCEWVQVRGQSWQDHVLEWLEGTGCDAWVFRSYAREAAAYALERIRHAGPGEAPADWIAYYRQRGVEEIHGGMIALRHRSGRNWVRIEDLAVDPAGPFGTSVERAFQCIDWMELHPSDEEMLAARPRLAPDVQLDQQSRQIEGTWQTVGMALRFTAGMPGSMRLEPAVARFLAGFDGQQTLAELIGRLSQRVQADPATVRRDCLAVVRKLMEHRFLVP